MNGIKHFTAREQMTRYAASKNVPVTGLSVAIAGLLLIIGGLGVLLGMQVEWSLGILAVILTIISFWMHTYWNERDAQARMADKTNFWKNLALVGALLMMYFIALPWPYSLMG